MEFRKKPYRMKVVVVRVDVVAAAAVVVKLAITRLVVVVMVRLVWGATFSWSHIRVERVVCKH